MKNWIDQNVDAITDALSPCRGCFIANTKRDINLPGTAAITAVLEKLLGVLYPGCHGQAPVAHENGHVLIKETLRLIATELYDQAHRTVEYACKHAKCISCGDCQEQARKTVTALLEGLPAIRGMLQEDIQAAYEGDPSARTTMEIVMSYPGLYAITVHRIAHALYQQGLPLIPRVMSEHAHARTGIDIHPGASIGPGFFIDHGTGVVIGETCRIGRRVKLYQGVTLGALSFAKDETGALVKGGKRHPDVEDNVIIYAGATVLGGDTVIGHDSVIGGNVWLPHSVPPGSKVYNRSPAPVIH
ncbi:MAG: serine O-acetyltransferase [Kiritimatiellaeota bacterium]|nr:serine O-acetyltransferase [Kiritimatiellota bacterium]